MAAAEAVDVSCSVGEEQEDSSRSRSCRIMVSRSSIKPGMSTNTSTRTSLRFLRVTCQGMVFHAGVSKMSRFLWRIEERAYSGTHERISMLVGDSRTERWELGSSWNSDHDKE